MEFIDVAIALGGSLVAGVINTLAGNGSTITLAVLTEVLHLPGNVANGTNRLGIFAQSIASLSTYYRKGTLDMRPHWRLVAVMIAGAVVGVWIATRIDSKQFMAVYKVLMLLMVVVIIAKPERWIQPQPADARRLPMPVLYALLFILGIYGGFIQMGMGVFFLALMVLGAKYSLSLSNSLKNVVVGIYTFIVLLIFQYKGLIAWKEGSIMALGQGVGGWLGAHFLHRYPKADVWAYRLLVAIVTLAVGNMLWKEFFPT